MATRKHTHPNGQDVQDPAGILKYIIEYKTNHDGNSPTLRQICDECDISSTSVAHYLLKRLEAHGQIRLRTGEGRHRAIEVVGGQWQLCGVVLLKPQDLPRPRRKYRRKTLLNGRIIGYLTTRGEATSSNEIATGIGASIEDVERELRTGSDFSESAPGQWVAWE